MGRDKALLPWPPSAADNQTLLSAQIASLTPFTESIIVVAGNNFETLAPLVVANGASIVQNPEPQRGQFSSLQIGLRELVARGYDAAMITLVDSPPLSSDSLIRLRATFEQAVAQGMWGVAPEHSGKRGHPLFASRKLIDAFLTAPVTSNARTVKHEHAQLLISVPVPEALLNADINTPEQYAALAASEKTQH